MSKVLVDRELLENLASLWAAKGYGKVGSPGHCHEKPGIWDKGNGSLAGKPCAECAMYDAARAILAQPAEAEGVGVKRYSPSECAAPHTYPIECGTDVMASDYDALQAALSAVTAERDRLRSKWARVESERDQLRAKVEMLREDAERYRWLVASGVNVTSVGGEPVRLTDQLVDAAMAAKEA